jgi:hypothetical protein
MQGQRGACSLSCSVPRGDGSKRASRDNSNLRQDQPAGREGREGVDCRNITVNSEGLNRSMGAAHNPNARNYGRLGQPTGSNEGVARLPTQSTPLLTRPVAWNVSEATGTAKRTIKNDGGRKQPACGNGTPCRPARLHPLQPYKQVTTAPPPSPVDC